VVRLSIWTKPKGSPQSRRDKELRFRSLTRLALALVGPDTGGAYCRAW
jgi:hypothetical protein